MCNSFDSDSFRSLSRAAEELNRIVSPLKEQLKIADRWDEIMSPLLRMATFHQEVLPGVTAFDNSLANRLYELVNPYQPMLDNLLVEERLMGMHFAELVKPEIYIPSLSSGLLKLGQAAAQVTGLGSCGQGVAALAESVLVSKASKIAQLGQAAAEATIAGRITGLSQIEDDVESVAQAAKPWLTDLSAFSAFETALPDSNFGRLVGMEKSVAGLSRIMEQYNQMTSISAQIASITQIGLADSWRRAVTPPQLLLGLNDFAIKQYAQIQKAADDQTIAWRLGLIEAASEYVDEQVAWGTALALDANEDTPDVEINTPDFSEFPRLLGHAKRDNIDVEKAYEASQVKLVTDTGRLIIQKAKVINDCCKVRGKELLFSESDILNGAMILGGSFCRNADTLNEVMSTLYALFVKRTIINLIGHQDCFASIDKYRTHSEETKPKITKIQKNIYSEIIKIEDKIIESFEEVLEKSLFDEVTICSKVLTALLHVQGNRIYEGKNENAINDGIRDQLKMVYEVRDQTRQGDSVSGKDAGEVDLLICNGGNPWAIIEGLKISSLEKNYLDTHIQKALVNYDPFGCPLVYILVFAKVKLFDEFWSKLIGYVADYRFPYEVVEAFREINSAYTESRHGKTVLQRNGKKISVHLYAVAMR